MKVYLIVSLFALSLFSCKQSSTEKNADLTQLEIQQNNFDSFGEKISPENSLNALEMKQIYSGLNLGDTVTAKFTTSVLGVCKMKGCWMSLELPETEKGPMVKFKDYGFFVPKDIEGREVIVEGIAFVEETSVEDQKHLAKDAGKTSEEIDKITGPSKTYGFLAHGVLLKK